jgi:uncharacterized membrane protein
VATLLVVSFPYPTTACAAAEDVLRLEPDLAVEPDAVAIVSRNDQGVFHVTTNHLSGRDERGSFWHLLLGALLFLPVSPVPPDAGVRYVSQQLARLGMDQSFQQQVRDMLAPDTSALFLFAGRGVAGDVLPSLRRFGGRPVTASLAPDVEDQVLRTLDGKLLFGWTRLTKDAQADQGTPGGSRPWRAHAGRGGHVPTSDDSGSSRPNDPSLAPQDIVPPVESGADIWPAFPTDGNGRSVARPE